MPMDKGGKYHMNAQRAMAADKMMPAKGTMPMKKEAMPMDDGGDTDGGHPMAKVAEDHGMGGKHMYIHHDGMGGMTSHHMGEDGKMEGPHDHANMDALKAHMDQFLSEEANEGSDGGAHKSMSMHHDGGMMKGY